MRFLHTTSHNDHMDYENNPIKETGYIGAFFYSLLAATIITLVFSGFTAAISLPNIVLVFLLATFILAFKLGRRAGLISAILNVGYFDYFFVPPRFSFSVENSDYLITFLVMLIVGLLTGHLVAKLKDRVDEIQKRQSFMEGLQQFAQKMLLASSVTEISQLTQTAVEEILKAKVAVYIGDVSNISSGAEQYINPEIKSWCLHSGITVDEDEGREQIVSVTYQPIKQDIKVIGVLIAIDREGSLTSLGKKEILGMAANLVAMAVTRLKTLENEQLAKLQIEKEQLKNAILSSLSHDVRTPLTAMIANAESLLASRPADEHEIKDGLRAIRDHGNKLSQLMGDLIELSKLQLEEPPLNKSLQPIEEVIGSSIAHFKLGYPERCVVVNIEPELGPVAIDEVLIERVLCNLLENAARASKEDAPIIIKVKNSENMIEFSIIDSGTGIVDSASVSGDRDKRRGLGLLIIRAILDAHKGAITLSNRTDGQGAVARFTLPI